MERRGVATVSRGGDGFRFALPILVCYDETQAGPLPVRFVQLAEEQLNVSAPDSPLAGMVDFLESFYTRQALLEQIERLSAAGELEKAEVLARALRQGADWHGTDRGVRRRTCRRLIGDAVARLRSSFRPPRIGQSLL